MIYRCRPSIRCILGFYLFILLGLSGAGCEKLPGQRYPFALGPLHFGMTLEEVKAVFAKSEMHLDAYDTPLGQTWSVLKPFGDHPPAPQFITRHTERLALTFWDNRLLRIRLHETNFDLVDQTELKKKFDRAYKLKSDESKGENLFCEYEGSELKVFLTGGHDRTGAVAFVDWRAYQAMDAARERYQKQAAAAFNLDGLRFGMNAEEAEKAVHRKLQASTFFEGLDTRGWTDETTEQEWALGFAPELGLSAIAIVYQERWAPDQVEELVLERTKKYGQGEIRPSPSGYSLVIDVVNLRVSLIIMDCNQAGCMVSEGWMWAGPEIKMKN